MATNRVQAVIFDADGTLFNSRQLLVNAYKHIAKEHDLKAPTAGEVASELSQSKPIPAIMASLFPGSDSAKLIETNAQFLTRPTSYPALFPGVKEVLFELHTHGVALGIVTGGSKQTNDWLILHGIADLFTSVVTFERVSRYKPDPEGFLLAVAECGTTADHAVMVGDSSMDVLSGINGNALATIGVTYGFGTAAELTEIGANYLIDDPWGLPAIIKDLDA